MSAISGRPLWPLALIGFTSVEQFIETWQKNPRLGINERLPDGCYLNAELDVRRVWGEEIRRIVQGGLSQEERLKQGSSGASTNKTGQEDRRNSDM